MGISAKSVTIHYQGYPKIRLWIKGSGMYRGIGATGKVDMTYAPEFTAFGDQARDVPPVA